MASLSLAKNDLPFLLAGSGEILVHSGDLKLNEPIAEGTAAVLSVSFKGAGTGKVVLGQIQTVKLAVSTAADLSLTPVFPSSTGITTALLRGGGLGDFFKNGANADKVVLILDVGASARISVPGSFRYSALKSTAEINAGADGGYTYMRAFNKSLPLQKIVFEFFKSMRLPEQVDREPYPGESISLHYGGYLRLGAEVSAGYQLAGTRAVSLGDMALSEKYDLSILGKIGLTAGIAGNFSVLVTAAPGLPGWARVQVHRQRSGELKAAADVNVGFKNQLDSLPSSADEFLGAALGVNAKNFLNVLRKAQELSDFEKFKGAIDALARKYISEFMGKSFEELRGATGFAEFLERVNAVVTSYEEAGDRAVTLFDHYFDKLAALTSFLDRIQNLEARTLDTLGRDLSPDTWNILSQLTDGDPLGFLLQQVTVDGARIDSLAELKKRARATVDLIRNEAHAEIRKAIVLAKQSFGVDGFFRELAKIDTVDELQAVATEKAGLFASRLVGRTLDSATNLKEAFRKIRAVLNRTDDFKDKLYKVFKEAAKQSYRVGLNAAYSRVSESDTLIDVSINMSEPPGAALLAQAGRGDFEEILTARDTGLVRLQEGVFTHRIRRENSWKVNIIGWHLNYEYEGFDRVITETEQRLLPSDQGITVVTSADLTVERMSKRRYEQTHVNFLLRALGESAEIVTSDGKNTAYFVDALKSLTARYGLSFTDEDTTETELRDYLAFARDVGLDRQGATLEALRPFLPRAQNGGFGKVETSYDIRFGEKALDALLSVRRISATGEASVRNAMRQMVLSNYLKDDEQHDVAFAYASPGVFDVFTTEGFAEFGNHSQRVLPVRLPIPGISAPAQVALDRNQLSVLITLYNIENSMVRAIKDLYRLLASEKVVDPREFEKKLSRFGGAMSDFDAFDQTTSRRGCGASTIFAMFDVLVRLASAGDPANTALLHLKSEANGKEVEKTFLSDEAARAAVEKLATT